MNYIKEKKVVMKKNNKILLYIIIYIFILLLLAFVFYINLSIIYYILDYFHPCIILNRDAESCAWHSAIKYIISLVVSTITTLILIKVFMWKIIRFFNKKVEKWKK